LYIDPANPNDFNMAPVDVLRVILFSVGYLILFFSILPLIRSDYWIVRIFDYPRSQKFWVNAAIIVAFLFVTDFEKIYDIVFLSALLLNQGYLLSLIWSYTPLASHQLKKILNANENSVKILIANVYQDNRNYDLCIAAIKQNDPDIILLVETDQLWCKEIQARLKGYPYHVLQPQSDTYGMVLFSKLEIVNHVVRFLFEPNIPSIKANIKTRDGQIFCLYCLHPKPPVPGESNDSTDRDAEILMIGKEAKKSKQPIIVAGDLNDVAWSYTTNLFLKVSGLLDPRIGRGFYSTFHAKHKLLRWPLDHVFCSSHFYLQDLKRLPSIDSDHFPIFIEVSLMPHEIESNRKEKKKADKDDIKLADKKIEAAQ
jgi:endonuclease/exonuclease/phosphatase (EEP) superfamily protein YafD